MNRAPRWQVVVFFLYLAVQIAVPLYNVFGKGPARFSWQMFSSSSVPARIWVVSDQGEREIQGTTYVGNYRADLDYERYAPPQLCRAIPDAKVIRYLMPLDDTVREYRC